MGNMIFYETIHIKRWQNIKGKVTSISQMQIAQFE